MTKKAIVDIGNPLANMYGCLPCPKCGSTYRATFTGASGQLTVECDDCGLVEDGEDAEEET